MRTKLDQIANGIYSGQSIFMFNLPWWQAVKIVKLHHCSRGLLQVARQVRDHGGDGALDKPRTINPKAKDSIESQLIYSICINLFFHLSHPCFINQFVYTIIGNGKKLACALANHTAHVLDIPQTSKQRVYSGRYVLVTFMCFSLNVQANRWCWCFHFVY